MVELANHLQQGLGAVVVGRVLLIKGLGRRNPLLNQRNLAGQRLVYAQNVHSQPRGQETDKGLCRVAHQSALLPHTVYLRHKLLVQRPVRGDVARV